MEILDEMIQPSARVNTEGSASNPRVVLTEEQDTESSATIKGLPSDAMVIKVDSFEAPNSIFQGTKGECKRADFIIISESKKCMVFIELKRKKDPWNQIVLQLTGALCVVNYFKNVGQSFWEDDSFLAQYSQHFVSIGHTYIGKRKTRCTQKGPDNHTPDKALKIDWPKSIQFNSLTGI